MRSTYILKFIFIFLFVFLFSTSIYAQDKNTEKLQSIFESLLEQQSIDLASQGKTIERDGDVLVEKSDDFYAITLPPTKITDSHNRSMNDCYQCRTERYARGVENDHGNAFTD
jgi:cell division protein FtsI/penicillin-binding protein 2